MSYEHTFRNPTFMNRATGKIMPNMGDWQTRHMSALRTPQGFEAAIVHMLAAWAHYADDHARRYESGIGDDGVLGEAWESIGRSIRTLLNGECGRLDCGTLDAFICDTLESEGFKT